MSDGMIVWAGGVIALAVCVGVARLALAWRANRTRPAGPSAALAGLQALAGLLVFLTLFPPVMIRPGGVLVVATEGTPAGIARAPGEIVVALPEAGLVAEASRAPDLTTALRQHPDVGSVRVVGHGLEARDRIATGRRLTFTPPPVPAGLTELSPPAPAAAGAPFSVGGRVGANSARAELVDPAGEVVDRADVAAGGRFTLSGQMRTAGRAVFTLRLMADGGAVDQIAVPVEARPDPQPVVLVLAGVPTAETRHLRRWAQDVGVDMRLQVDLGGGAAIGDPAVALTREALAAIDLLIIDDRRWERLDAGQRAAVAAAVDAGMGLLLRPEGPISAAVRRDWAQLNMPLTGDGDVGPVMLSVGGEENDLVELARVDLSADGPRTVVLARDSSGAALIAWRSKGRGRVGVWAVTDSYVLALSGQTSRHGELWSATLSALSRPLRMARPNIQAPAFAGTRMQLCGVSAGSVVSAGQTQTTLIVDPISGGPACAAYWPQEAGWHAVLDRAGVETAFYVHAKTGSGALARTERRAATQAMTTLPPGRSIPAEDRGPGSPWPWFAALMVVLSVLWWFERRFIGRQGQPNSRASRRSASE